jgi:hypothetical protein
VLTRERVRNARRDISLNLVSKFGFGWPYNFETKMQTEVSEKRTFYKRGSKFCSREFNGSAVKDQQNWTPPKRVIVIDSDR